MAKPPGLRHQGASRVGSGKVTSTDVQNRFGVVLDRVAREGMVEITKHNRTFAVLLSADAFQRLTVPPQPSTEQLSFEIGALLDRMQTPEAKAAVDTLFAMDEPNLGAAAVRQAQAARRRVKPSPGSGKVARGVAAQPAPRAEATRKRSGGR